MPQGGGAFIKFLGSDISFSLTARQVPRGSLFSTPFLHSRWQLQAQGRGSENLSLAFGFLSFLFSFLRADLCLHRGICMFMWVCAFIRLESACPTAQHYGTDVHCHTCLFSRCWDPNSDPMLVRQLLYSLSHTPSP